jgi:hypothetical protein
MAGKRETRRLVRRYYAERYLLITIISFAFSVSLTRFFLDLTGYPQIGGSQLHIAHVLWGGLLLFAGGLLPLIFANKRAFDLSALFSGVGVGLFIDEVGKFITASNDYFFPAAAPIVYALFLLTLLVFQLVRRSRPTDMRSTLYHVVEQFEEILEGDLSQLERDRMLTSIRTALAVEKDTHLAEVADNLLNYLEKQEETLVPHQPDFIEKLVIGYLKFEEKIFNRPGFFTVLLVVWGIWGIVTLFHPLLVLLSAQTRIVLSGVWASLLASDLLVMTDLTFTGILRLAGEALCGFLLLSAIFIALKGYKRPAIALAMISLLTLLVIVNIFIFYFDQFSTIFYTFIQAMILLFTIRYNKHYA